MITRDEITRSLNSAWALFLDRPNAVLQFDASYNGFWRSFQAIILVAPAYAPILLADRKALMSASDAGTYSDAAFMTARLLTVALDWITLPLLLAGLSNFLAIRRGYTTFVVARNWSSVLMVLPFAVIALFDLGGALSPELLFIPSVLALAVTFRFSYLIARRALDVAVDVAVGFVVLDFLVSLALARLISRVLGVEAPA